MRKVTSKPTMPKSWVSSPLTRALCASGLNTSHKIRKASNMSWSQVESILSGATLKPHGKTIQKLMAVSGISRQQYGGHTRVINALHTPVDKSVVKKATTRLAAKKPKAPTTSGTISDLVIQIHQDGQTTSINVDQLKRILLSQ